MSSGLTLAALNGKSSLLARQRQMAVTGQNISNSNIAGYHRQSAIVSANPPVNDLPGEIGMGVRVEKVIRAFDSTLENNLLQTTEENGYNQAYSTQLEQIEKLVAPNGESPLASAVADFAGALQGLASDPESESARQALLAKATGVADEFNSQRDLAKRQLQGIADAGGQGALSLNKDRINQLAGEVSQLNEQIHILENRRFNAQQANDLRDQRDQVVSELAKLTDLGITRNNDTTYTLDIGGTLLVDGLNPPEQVDVAMTAGVPSLVWHSTGTALAQETGETRGQLDAFARLSTWITGIADFASTFTSVMNTAHKAGFDLAGNGGTDLFAISGVTGDVSVAISDPDLVAAGTVANLAGDGGNGRAMWTTLNSAQALLGGNTLANHSDRMLNTLAQDTSAAKAAATNSDAAVNMLREAVGSVSGVTLDQEMMDMLDLQRAYQASAKFISVVDGLVGTVIGMVGG